MNKKKVKWYYFIFPVICMFIPAFFLFVRPSTKPYIVAVPADQAAITSPVSPMFSRAAYFIIYDCRNNTAKSIVNKSATARHEVGLHVTQLLLREKVGTVIAKNVGVEPYTHLSMRGVKIYIGSANSVEEAIYKFKIGVLTCMTGPTGFFKIFGF